MCVALVRWCLEYETGGFVWRIQLVHQILLSFPFMLASFRLGQVLAFQRNFQEPHDMSSCPSCPKLERFSLRSSVRGEYHQRVIEKADKTCMSGLEAQSISSNTVLAIWALRWSVFQKQVHADVCQELLSSATKAKSTWYMLGSFHSFLLSVRSIFSPFEP